MSKYEEAKAAEKVAFAAWSTIGDQDRYATCVSLSPAEAKQYEAARTVWEKAEEALYKSIEEKCQAEDLADALKSSAK